MTGYVRKDTSNNIADGNIINAADLDAEFDGIVDAFNASTGHKHDGTTGEGAPITVVGPTQDVTVSATAVTPKTTNTVDLGSSSLNFKDIFIAGTATLPTVSSTTGNITTVNATTVDTTNVEVTNIKAKDGTASASIANATGVMTIASAILTTADINGGTIDGTVIGGAAAAAGAFTTLSASGGVTFSGGTANGVAYLNGSKVLTTGSALTFDGTNFGVGTSSPTATGNYRVTEIKSANATSGGMLILGTSDNSGVARLYNTSTQIILDDGNSTSDIYIKTNGSNPLLFGISNTEQMRLTSTGLGIGTSSPSAVGSRTTVHVNGTAGAALRLSDDVANAYLDYTDTSGARLFVNAAEPLLLGTNSLERLRIDSSGNLGLGVTPSAWKTDYRAFTNGYGSFYGRTGGSVSSGFSSNAYVDSAGTWTYTNSQFASRYQQELGTHIWFTAPSGTAGNAISFTQAMTLDASGKLLVGTTTAPSAATVKMAIQGASGADSYYQFGNGSGGGGIIGSVVGGGIQMYTYTGAFGSETYTERARIDSSGNFGIGTSSPNAPLSFANAVGRKVDLYYGGAGNEFALGVQSSELRIATGTSSFISFYTGGYSGGSEKMRLDSSGNLGLGVTPSAWTSTASKALQVNNFSMVQVDGFDTSSISTNAFYNGSWRYIGSATAVRYDQFAGSHRWLTAPSGTAGNAISFTQAMTLDASGNLGIGTTSPSYKLHVVGGQARIDVSAASTSLVCLGTGSNFQVDHSTSGYATLVNSANSGAAMIFKGSSESMRIDPSGNLLVGTTSGTDFKLRVDRSDNNGLCALRNSATSGITYDQLQIMVGQSASANYFFGRFYASSGASPQFAFRGDGQMFATSTSISSISDARVKENVRDSNDGLQTVLGLRPVRFDFKEGFGNNRKNQLGFIAQEVEGVFPDAVDVAGSVTEDGDAHKSVAPGTLIPVLVKAIQEQQAIINQLKADVAAMKAAA